MNSYLAVPAIVGVFTVVQAGMNRHVAKSWGLPAAVLLNGAILTVVALAVFVWARASGVSGLFAGKADWTAFRPFWLISGVLGFGIVLGIPFAMDKIGATRAFVVIVSAQMIGSVLWDLALDGVRPTPARLGGALLAIGSAVLVSWK